MPLVVPDVAAQGGDKHEWLNKLAGKKISESTSDVTTFAKSDLPEEHRIIKAGDPVTMDFRPNRLNIQLDEQGVVRDVNYY